jgi:signal transduction histidine kinase
MKAVQGGQGEMQCQAHHIHIEVEDRGKGIPPEKQF